MKIIIVNEKDEIIGEKEKGSITQQDIFRVCSLWIHNSNGQVLLAQRSKRKKNHPGKWAPAVEGTLSSGDEYTTKICTRAQEELGISIFIEELTVGKKIRILFPYNHFNQNFRISMDDLNIERDITINTQEVEQLAWFDIRSLKVAIEKNPENFVGSLLEFL